MIKRRIEEIDMQIQELLEEKSRLCKEYLEEHTEGLDTPEKFSQWVSMGGGSVDEPWTISIESSSGRELMMAMESPLYPQRGVTYTIKEIGDCVLNYYRAHNVADNDPIKQDCIDWMNILMDKDISSICYDW